MKANHVMKTAASMTLILVGAGLLLSGYGTYPISPPPPGQAQALSELSIIIIGLGLTVGGFYLLATWARDPAFADHSRSTSWTYAQGC